MDFINETDVGISQIDSHWSYGPFALFSYSICSTMIDIIVALTFWRKSHCEVHPGEIPGHYDLVLPIPNSWKPCLNTSVLINVSIPSQASVLGSCVSQSIPTVLSY